MLFNSLQFIIFFPIALFITLILPGKGPFRHIWLLICSYFFYMCWDARYILLIMFTTLVTFLSGLLMDRVLTRKFWVAFAFICNLSVLFYFKYVGFFLENLGRLIGLVSSTYHLPEPDITLPVGISFFTFQALSYTMDVYRGDVKPEKSLFRYALYVSFFPQLVAGPIERSGRLLSQLRKPIKPTWNKAEFGLLLMLWGFFQKVVLADRIALVVNCIYGDPESYKGTYLLVATILFAFQIYCDFGGYSSIARGAALFFGIELMENFDAPYKSRTVAEFWRRWHISLSSWLRDYLYIPLGGSRKGKLRKYFNIMVVFLASGLWHGARWSFVVWGGLNGLYQIIGERLRALLPDKLAKRTSALVTFALVDFTWIFFRAEGLSQAILVIKNMFGTFNPQILWNGSLYECGLEAGDFNLMIIALLLLILADELKYRKLSIARSVYFSNWLQKGAFVGICIWALLLFGVWGSAYNPSSFIYFAF